MSDTRFAVADDESRAHCSSARRNSPWPIFAVLILGAIALSAMWYVGRGPIRVTRPTLTVEDGKVIAVSKATNRTNQSVTLSLSFILGYVSRGKNTASPAFKGISHQEMDVRVAPHSSQTVRCEFLLDNPPGSLEAEVQILRCD